MQDFISIGCGALVGFFLGLTGGGGSILAVPLILYVTGIGDAHLAIGTGAATVLGSALLNLFSHARKGKVRWKFASIFALAGVVGVASGSTLGKETNGQLLLGLLALLMLVIAWRMQRRTQQAEDGMLPLTPAVAFKLAATAVAVGFLAGFFGIGGGFLIVPGLIFASRMATIDAIGSSLLCITAFSSMTTLNYASSHLVSWHVALDYLIGGLFGSQFGPRLAQHLAHRRDTLNRMFGGVLVMAACYILCRTAVPVVGHSPAPFNPIQTPQPGVPVEARRPALPLPAQTSDTALHNT